jgi:3D (Asp-Asp-Asp) domain-containing protein
MKTEITITCLLFLFFLAPSLGKFETFTDECDLQYHLESMLPYNEDKTITTSFIAEVSAYTLGRESETDNSPCIGASGEDMCAMARNGLLMFANNYYKLGTVVCISSVGCGVIKDRMNERYGRNNFDVATLNLKENIRFGRKNLLVTVYSP